MDKGAAAENKILREGDKLISINGMSISALSLVDIQDLFRGPARSLIDITEISKGGGWCGIGMSTARLQRSTVGGEEGDWNSPFTKSFQSVAIAEDLHAESDRLHRTLYADS